MLDTALNDALAVLTYCQKDTVFSTVNSLCAEHEQIAFLAGLQFLHSKILRQHRTIHG